MGAVSTARRPRTGIDLRRLAIPANIEAGLAFGCGVTTIVIVAGSVALAITDNRLEDIVSAAAVVALALTGSVVVSHRPGHRLGWLFIAAGLCMAFEAGSIAYARHTLEVAPDSLPAGREAAWLAGWFPLATNGLLFAVLPLLFPDGALVSRRMRPALWAGAAFIVFGTIGNAFLQQPVEGLTNQPNPFAIEPLRPRFSVLIAASGLCLVVAVAGGIVSLVLRWRRAEGDERQQLKWFVAGLLPAAFGVLVVHNFISVALGDLFIGATLPFIPVVLGVAILRYRLYDLDLVINRALVYALLSGLVVAIYLTVVTVLEQIAGNGHGLASQAAATLAAAAAFQPLRSQAQRLVDRLFYGDRARPYDVLARLGQRLELAPVPETVLQGIVDTVAAALRLPSVAIEFREGNDWVTVAHKGESDLAPVVLPMVYQGEAIGRLLVCRRAVGEEFNGDDLRLLADLARQAGVATHAVRVTADLQRSRAALVTAREEERRRLRRDLHDGLGPALAGVTLGLHAARATLQRDTTRAERLLADLEAQVQDAVNDIRRLVYGLRPPALDEVGLVRALQQQASRMESGAGEFIVEIDAPPDGLPGLPAAVEVAAYRIATEAMTNASRHALARVCRIALTLNGGLEVRVSDNGTGLPEGAVAGVGLTSMQERAAELGGSLSIESSGSGTTIVALLPLPNADD
jgi:signal transduction histidine kinase